MKYLRVAIGGGGTGGHVYPAIAIADALKRLHPSCEIQFVGAKGRLEATAVPKAGYEITLLDIAGLDRRKVLNNISLPWKLWKSGQAVERLLKTFRPHVAVGVGGYASFPLLSGAIFRRIPTLIQEQNAVFGLTNKWLSRYVDKVCGAWAELSSQVPDKRWVLTGNPVRTNIYPHDFVESESLSYFSLTARRPTILVLGGSLGARTLNQTLSQEHPRIADGGYNLIWQCGKAYHESLREEVRPEVGKTALTPFIDRMDLAYGLADVVISRAGAISIAELQSAGKATILVPSPNVAGDHQTKNALALQRQSAAVIVTDAEAGTRLVDQAIALLNDHSQRTKLEQNISRLAMPEAADNVAKEILALAERGGKNG